MKKISCLLIIILSFLLTCKVAVNTAFSKTSRKVGTKTKSTKVQLKEALKLVEQEEYQRATEILESLLPNVQDVASRNRTLYVLGNSFRRQNKWDKAIEYYQQVPADYILWDYIKLHIAESYQAQNDYQNALVWYERFLSDHPKHPTYSFAQYQLALCYMKAENYEAALKIYSQLIDNKLNGYSRAAQYQSGKAYEALGQWQQAYFTYQHVIDRNSSDSMARDALERINALVAAHHHNNIKITRERRLSMGMVLFDAGKYIQARNELGRVVSDYRDDLAGKATYFIAQSYYRQGRYDDAITAYQEIVNFYPTSDYLTRALYQTALCYERKEQLTKAQQLLKDFVAQYSWSAWADNALYEIATSLKHLRQYEDAIKVYTQLTEQYAKSDLVDEARWDIGWCYFKLGRYQDSITSFQTFVTTFPKSKYVGQAQYWVGKIYEKQNELVRAREIYDKIIREHQWYYSIRAVERIQALFASENIGVNENIDISNYRRINATSDSSLWRDMERLDSPRARELIASKAFDDAITELESLAKSGKQNLKQIYYNLILSRQKEKQFYQAYLDGLKLFRLSDLKNKGNASPTEAYKLIYPFYFQDIITKYSTEYGIDPLFVISMMREESGYDVDAISHAGACGLMQIMPGTGADVAQRLKISSFEPTMLFEPETNIQIGTWYMKNLMDTFDNNHALVSGAYNGGPGRMKKWLEELDLSDMDEFIEDIPINETRRHIKKVMDSYYIYKELYPESYALPQISKKP
ncbi:tetratricopeptide repeat protein [Candidatus Poribacteria bacterium]|nr:tetratricopeptide repeat protein [Candidatus Poribacteria bacterium]